MFPLLPFPACVSANHNNLFRGLSIRPHINNFSRSCFFNKLPPWTSLDLPGFSDHSLLPFIFSIAASNSAKIFVLILNYRKANFRAISTTFWILFNDLDEMASQLSVEDNWCLFRDKVPYRVILYDLVRTFSSKLNSPWYNSRRRRLSSKNKKLLFRAAKRSKQTEIFRPIVAPTSIIR